jgi:hypothetical protein
MIYYNSRAAKALGFLKKPYNEIEIYVEDTSNPTMWLRVLKRILPNTVRMQSVSPLGGRKNVVDACRLDQAEDGRKKLYIIDADFDYLTNRKKPRLRHLYRINAYCIENVLLQPSCIVELCVDLSTNSNILKAYSELDFPGMIGVHEELLRKLFLVYATSQEVRTGVQTVQFSTYKLMSNVSGMWQFEVDKLRRRVLHVVRESINAVGLSVFSKKRRELRARATALPFHKVVSGKDYILPIVWQRVCKRFGYRGNEEQFKIQLAKEFRPEFEPWLSRRLLRLIA